MRVETPATRRDDPATSHAAEVAVTASGQRRRQQLEAAAAVRRYPGWPSSELARLSGLDRYMLARRLPEIEAGEGPGMVLRIGTARDSVTGRHGGRWFPVEYGVALLRQCVDAGDRNIPGIRDDYGAWVADRVAEMGGVAMAEWKPGSKVPTNQCVGMRVFVRDGNDQSWHGPMTLEQTLSSSSGCYPFRAGGRSWRCAVLAEPVEAEEPDPYRIDPDDLKEGEWVMVWSNADAEPKGPCRFTRYAKDFGVSLFCATANHAHFCWRHARRATPAELQRAGIGSAEPAIETNDIITTGHPSAPVLREIVEDLSKDAEAWREWEFWAPFTEKWVIPASVKVLLDVTMERPESVRRRPRPHHAKQVLSVTCGKCGSLYDMEIERIGEWFRCGMCWHEASIEEGQA